MKLWLFLVHQIIVWWISCLKCHIQIKNIDDFLIKWRMIFTSQTNDRHRARKWKKQSSIERLKKKKRKKSLLSRSTVRNLVSYLISSWKFESGCRFMWDDFYDGHYSKKRFRYVWIFAIYKVNSRSETRQKKIKMRRKKNHELLPSFWSNH